METVACNLCGSTRQTVVYRRPDLLYFPGEVFTVVECDECGLGFVNPRPSFEEMGKYYPPQYYEDFEKDRAHHLKRYAIEASYLRPGKSFAGGGKLLDVGCANGGFPIFMMSRSWTVEGVETSLSSKPIRDFKVYTVPFPRIPVDGPVYDAVTAWAVLEHVHDPMAYFRKASVVLKSGGRLVFLVTNFDSWVSRKLYGEDVPRHLYFFSSKTVRQYLEAAGFVLESEHFRGNIYKMPPRNWLHYLVRTLKGQSFSYRNLPVTRDEYFRRRGMQPGALSILKYAVHHPLTVVDRALLPVLAPVQMLAKSYGIFTIIARKL